MGGRAFDMIDKNKDGKITYSEFQAGIMAVHTGIPDVSRDIVYAAPPPEPEPPQPRIGKTTQIAANAIVTVDESGATSTQFDPQMSSTRETGEPVYVTASSNLVEAPADISTTHHEHIVSGHCREIVTQVAVVEQGEIQVVEVPELLIVEIRQEVPQIVRKSVEQFVEQIVEVPKVTTQRRVNHRTVEHFIDVPIPQTVEEIVHVPRIVDRVQEVPQLTIKYVKERLIEQIVEIPVPQTVEEIVEIPQIVQEERFVSRRVQQEIQVPHVHIVEKIIEVPHVQIHETVIQVPKITQTVVDTVIHNEVKTIEVEQKKVIKKTVRRKKPIRQEHITQVPRVVEEIVPVPKIVQKSVDVPQVNYIDEFIDVPVTRNRHVPVLQKVPRIIEVVQEKVVEVPRIIEETMVLHPNDDVPPNAIIDRFVDIPVIKEVQVPAVTKITKEIFVPIIEIIEKIIDIPVVVLVALPVTHTIERFVEVPIVQSTERVVEVPVAQHRAGTTRTIDIPTTQRQAAPVEIVQVVEDGPPLPPELQVSSDNQSLPSPVGVINAQSPVGVISPQQ